MTHIIAMGFLGILLLTQGCMQKPNLANEDNQEVSAEVIKENILNAWGDFHPSSIRKNEFVYIERTQQIQNLESQVVFQEGITVSDKTTIYDADNKPLIKYTLLHKTVEFINNESKSSTTEESFVIEKPNDLQSSFLPHQTQTQTQTQKLSADHEIKPMTISALVALNFMNMCVNKPDWDAHCYEFTSEDVEVPVPPSVKSQPNCGNIPQCQIRAKNISFKFVLNSIDPETKESHKEKVIYSFTISQDVPYLSRLLKFCYRGLVTLKENGQKVLVNVCNDVRSFNPGDH